MDKELNQLQQLFNQDNVRVEKCGIGKVNAALGAQRMIYEFHKILSSAQKSPIMMSTVGRRLMIPPSTDKYKDFPSAILQKIICWRKPLNSQPSTLNLPFTKD